MAYEHLHVTWDKKNFVFPQNPIFTTKIVLRKKKNIFFKKQIFTREE